MAWMSGRLGFALLAMILMGWTVPVEAQAGPADKVVTLSVERADIRSALKELFTSAGINYTLSDEVRGTVTVALQEVPFRTALATVLRSAESKNGITFRVEDGIYSIVPRIAESVVPEPPATVRTMVIPLNYVPAERTIQDMGRLLGFGPSSGLSLQRIPTTNAILARGTDEQISELKQAIRSIDLMPQSIMLKAETVMVVKDAAGKKHRATLSSMAWAPPDRPTRMRSVASGESPSKARLFLSSGLSDVRVKARINGDHDTVSLDADWDYDFSWLVPGRSTPLRLRNTFNSSKSVRSGDTITLSGTIVKLGGDSGESEAEILLFITPSIEGVRPTPRNAQPTGTIRASHPARP